MRTIILLDGSLLLLLGQSVLGREGKLRISVVGELKVERAVLFGRDLGHSLVENQIALIVDAHYLALKPAPILGLNSGSPADEVAALNVLVFQHTQNFN